LIRRKGLDWLHLEKYRSTTTKPNTWQRYT